MKRSRLTVAALALVPVLLAQGCLRHAGRVPATAPGGADSRSAFSKLTEDLREGTRVRVTVADRRLDGLVNRIDRGTLEVRTEHWRELFACREIDRVERHGDSLWSGAVIGGAILALPAWNGCQNQGRNISCVVLGVGMFASLGALVDRAHAGWTTVYAAAPGSCGRP